MDEATAKAALRARQREYTRKYREKRGEAVKDRRRQLNAENPEKKREQDRRYREANRDRIAAYREANRDAAIQRSREWRAANRDRILPLKRERQRAYYQEKRLDPEWMERQRETQRRHRTANRQRIRMANRLRKHCLTPEGWTALWVAQEGRCYLCLRELSTEDAMIEHDHRCCPKGASCSVCRRGLACGPCNAAIGFADDDPERLLLMAANLRAARDAVAERMKAKAVQGTLFGDDCA